MGARQNTTANDNQEADAIDIRIASLLIERPSSTDDEIAEIVGLCRQSVNVRKNSKDVQDLIKKTLSIHENEVRRLTAKALSRFEAFLDDEDPKIRLAAVLALLRLSQPLVSRSMSFGFCGL